jgi:hypothetical protein
LARLDCAQDRLSDKREAAVVDTREGRILFVVPAGADDFTATVLEKFDHPVTTCTGPEPDVVCPLVRGDGCPWFEEAHGIVFSLDLRLPAHQAILREYEHMAADAGRDLPIRVVVPAGAVIPDDLLDAARVWSANPSVAELDGFAAEVEAADRFA